MNKYNTIQPTLSISRNEWHRFRIVNTNMAYLIWQLNRELQTIEIDAFVSPDECQVWLLGNDGVNFEDGPRLIYNAPYNGSIVIPPGGRADVMLNCFTEGFKTVIASPDTRNFTFSNAPIPDQVYIVMNIYVYNNLTNYSDPTIDGLAMDQIPCVTNPQNCSCYDWNSPGLPCQPLPYEYSPYLADTQGEVYPNLTSTCLSEYDVNEMKLGYLIYKKEKQTLKTRKPKQKKKEFV